MTMVRLLGPVEVLDDDGVVHAPRTPLRRTLLALLALEAGKVVEPDSLIDRIWDGTPPESGLRALRFHLSRLRKEVAVDDLIVTVAGGYRLDADVDVHRVESTLDRIMAMDPQHVSKPSASSSTNGEANPASPWTINANDSQNSS